MGAPPTSQRSSLGPGSAQSLISAQHERLIVELLPFKDATKFKEWLQSSWVQGSWVEFCNSCLFKMTDFAEPNKATMAQSTRDAIKSKSQKYLVYNPDKTTWSIDDHHIRFMVTLIQDNLLRSLWSESDWKRNGLEISGAVFEVLSFLKATHYLPEHQYPPSYTQ